MLLLNIPLARLLSQNQYGKDNFEGKINPLNGQPYKSARNTVAGLFRRDDPPSELLKHVYFMRYGAFGEGVDNFLI